MKIVIKNIYRLNILIRLNPYKNDFKCKNKEACRNWISLSCSFLQHHIVVLRHITDFCLINKIWIHFNKKSFPKRNVSKTNIKNVCDLQNWKCSKYLLSQEIHLYLSYWLLLKHNISVFLSFINLFLTCAVWLDQIRKISFMAKVFEINLMSKFIKDINFQFSIISVIPFSIEFKYCLFFKKE